VAVARNADGDSIDAPIRWRTPDSTISLDSLTGTATAVTDAGTARIQITVFGRDTVLTGLAGLTLSLTPKADSLTLASSDSLTISRDTLDTQQIRFILEGGDPAVGVAGRPVIFRIVEPAPADSPGVAFQSGRLSDSLMTDATGTVTSVVKGVAGRTRPDRAVIEVNASRATGAKIPGSGRQVVVRFLHQ
jgi:hypothetical protein